MPTRTKMRRRPRTRRFARRGFLLPYNVAGVGTMSIKTEDFKFQMLRPIKPVSITLRYAATSPTPIDFQVFAGNSEEIYQSPRLIAGLAPMTFTARLPPGTDFALFASNENVVQFRGNGVTWAMRMICDHKDNN